MNYTSINQSKKLLKLGLNPESADMTYIGKDNVIVGPYLEAKKSLLAVFSKEDSLSPCWSLGALLGLMPFHIIEKNERYDFRQWKGYNTQGETYCFEYISTSNQRLYETYHWNNPIDAAFKMVCWLLENGHITHENMTQEEEQLFIKKEKAKWEKEQHLRDLQNKCNHIWHYDWEYCTGGTRECILCGKMESFYQRD